MLLFTNKEGEFLMNKIVTMPDLVRKVMEGLPEENQIDEAIARLLALAKIEDEIMEEKIGVPTPKEVEFMLEQWMKQTSQEHSEMKIKN